MPALKNEESQFSIGPFEEINTTILFSSKTFVLKSCGNKNYVGLNEAKHLCADFDKFDERLSRFEIKYLCNGLVALFDEDRKRFVSAENKGDENLVANRPKIFGTWEVFELKGQTNGLVAFKSIANGCYVTVDNSTNKLIAKNNFIDKNELFRLVEIKEN